MLIGNDLHQEILKIYQNVHANNSYFIDYSYLCNDKNMNHVSPIVGELIQTIVKQESRLGRSFSH